jgi:antibiotic biosynthesis monooxygenase (ABM) superfamily enzyme
MKDKKKNKNPSISKKGAIMVVGISTIGFLFVLFMFFLYPWMGDNLAVWQSFILVYALIIMFWAVLGIGIFQEKANAFKSTLILSIGSIALDLYVFSPSVNLNGSLNESPGSIDYTIGYYVSAVIGNNIFVFIITYFIIPLIIFGITYLLLKPKKFKEVVGKTV